MTIALPSGDRRNLVRISTVEGHFEGVVFTSTGQRLQDLLNDGRAFLPVELSENGSRKVKLISK